MARVPLWLAWLVSLWVLSVLPLVRRPVAPRSRQPVPQVPQALPERAVSRRLTPARPWLNLVLKASPLLVVRHLRVGQLRRPHLMAHQVQLWLRRAAHLLAHQG